MRRLVMTKIDLLIVIGVIVFLLATLLLPRGD